MKNPDDRECSDGYARVVAVLNSDWRVAICTDGVQFLLQRRAAFDPAAMWRSIKFISDAAHLRTRVNEMCGELEPEAARALAALPPRASLAALSY